MGGIARIAVLGAGSWGTALAALLARNGLDVRLCGRRDDALARVDAAWQNPRYLPGIELPAQLRYTTDPAVYADLMVSRAVDITIERDVGTSIFVSYSAIVRATYPRIVTPATVCTSSISWMPGM